MRLWCHLFTYLNFSLSSGIVKVIENRTIYTFYRPYTSILNKYLLNYNLRKYSNQFQVFKRKLVWYILIYSRLMLGYHKFWADPYGYRSLCYDAHVAKFSYILLKFGFIILQNICIIKMYKVSMIDLCLLFGLWFFFLAYFFLIWLSVKCMNGKKLNMLKTFVLFSLH